MREQIISVNSPSVGGVVSPLRDNDSDSCSSYSSTDTVEEQREEGQQKLRELVIEGASSGNIDWKSIISLAEELHRKEQRLLSTYKSSRGAGAISYSSGMNEYTSLGRRNISRKQAFFELRSKRKESARRKKLESVGSFSVNLLLYGTDECTNYCGESSSIKIESDFTTVEENEAITSCENIDESHEVEIFEAEENASVSSQSNQSQSDNHAALRPKKLDFQSNSSSAPTKIVEGSFLAATSLYTHPNFDEEDDSSESSNSESSSSTISFKGIEMERMQSSWDDDDGLVTIHEDASVNMW
jgi:hypothetical protein